MVLIKKFSRSNSSELIKSSRFITILQGGGGGPLGTPNLYYVIYGRPLRVIDNQLINSQNIFIPNLKCFPIWVIAGGDKQIVGLVLAVAVTKQHIAVFFLLFFYLI